MTHGKVDHCWRLAIPDMQEFIVDLESGKYTGGGRSGVPINFDLRRTTQGALVVQLWARQLPYPSSERVLLLSTLPTFGGKRWWFACPWCDRRCQVLFVPRHGGRFGCQRCLGLRYRSQSRSPQDRRQWQIEQMKFRLGARGDDTAPAAPVPPRPKGMQAKTYARLLQQLRRVECAYWHAVDQRLLRLLARRRRVFAALTTI